MAEEQDEVLAERAARGDKGSFEELVRRHRQGVYRLCWSVTGNHADADDAAQEAFLRAFRSLAGYDATRPFLPWLRRIAHNAGVDQIARRGAGKTVSLDETIPDPPDPSPTPEGSAAARERGALANAALNGLPAELREAFLLRAAEGLSYKEIAEATGAPVGTVMSRLSRARERIMSALADGKKVSR